MERVATTKAACTCMISVMTSVFTRKDEKFYLDYKKLALKYVGSNKSIYDFAKKNSKKTIFPGIAQTLRELDEYLEASEEEEFILNKSTKPNREDKKVKRDLKLETEKEMIDNKENVLENENEKAKKEDEEISTTTADNENKSQSANDVLTLIKNIELFVKKKTHYPPLGKPLIEKLLNEDEAASDNEDEENLMDFKNELLKNVIIMTKNELLELEKKCDEEIFNEIGNFLTCIKQPPCFNCFSSGCFFYDKREENAKKIQEWLNNEFILDGIEFDKDEKKDFIENLWSLDDKYTRMIERNFKKIEEMKEGLLNLTLNLRRERENLDTLKDKEGILTDCSGSEQKYQNNLTNQNDPTFPKEKGSNFIINDNTTLQTNKNYSLISEERIVSRKNKHKVENRNLTPKPESESKAKKTPPINNIFLNSNVFTLISEKNEEANSIESQSPFSDRMKEIDTSCPFITDEDVNQRKNDENEKNRKKKAKRKGKKLKKKKNNESEKEKEENFRKFIENFAKKPCDIPSPRTTTNKNLNTNLQYFDDIHDNFSIQSSLKIIVANFNQQKSNEQLNFSEISDAIKSKIFKNNQNENLKFLF